MANETQQQKNGWVKYYSSLISKNASTKNTNSNSSNNIVNFNTNGFIREWYLKQERIAQREDFMTPYFDTKEQLLTTVEQIETGNLIKQKLKEIIIRVSKDEEHGSMSSIRIRELLEKEMLNENSSVGSQNLDAFKKFIDVTIFQFYNQLVECASKILPYL